MKAAQDMDGNRIIEGSQVLAYFKGYAEPRLCKVTGIKTVNIHVRTIEAETDHKVRAEHCKVYREERPAKIIPDHSFQLGDSVIINKKSDVNGSKGTIVDFPNSYSATVLIPEKNWRGKTAIMPVCPIECLGKVN